MARFVRTESGSVFTITDPPCEILELVDGAWVKPVSPVGFTDLMDGAPLSETDVKKMIKTPRYVRTEDGRVFRLPASELAELVDGAWVAPVAPVFGGELMDAVPLSSAEIASIRVQEIEERAEERELAMLERLVQEHKARSQATPSADNHVQDTKKDEETLPKGFIGKVKTWLNASNSGFLWVLSKYLPVGCLVCVTPGNVFSFAGNTLEFIATALFYAFIAFVFTEAVDHTLGENATNLRRIKAIAAEVVFAAAMFWWLID